MPILGGSRTRLDSIIYWGIFFLFAFLITYFLNSMIALANDEEHAYTTATLVGYREQKNIIKEGRAVRDEESTDTTDTNETTVESAP
jgi:hypothetical protein